MANLYRRGRVWWVRFQWRGQEVRRSSRTTVKSEARGYLADLQAEYRKLDIGGRPRRAFTDAVIRYGEDDLPKLKVQTIASYQQSLRVLVDHFGDLYLDEITRGRIAEFESEQLKRVSASKVKHYRAALSGVFKLALRYEWIDVNPCRSLDPIKLPKPSDRYLSKDEWLRLDAAASEPLRSIARVAVTTGMRCGEILNLEWGDLSFRRDEITIRETKNSEWRVIPMERASAHFPAQRGLASERVFTGTDGRPLTVSGVSKQFSRLTRSCRVDGVSFHTLRHTYASWYVQDGGDLYKLQRLLGHKTPTMTQRYAKLRIDDLRTKTGTAARDFLH